jgi:hypothetical protein
MTLDHPLRRALARVCSAATMSRVVDPVLADMRAEHGRATLGGCYALARALALHTMTTVPARANALWSDDDHAMPRAAGFVTATALLAAVPLLAPPLFHVPGLKVISPVTLAMTLLPQALALTLPASLLIAVPLALSRVRLNRRLIQRTLLLSTAVLAANFIVVLQLVPDANQSFREAVARAAPAGSHPDLRRGPMETDQATLRQEIEDLKHTRGGEVPARRLEYTYQLRLAIVAAAIPLGLAGLAVSVTRRGRGRVLLSIAILVTYWALMAFEERTANTLIGSGGFLPEYLCAWTPNLITLIAASAFLRVRRSAFAIQH